MRSKIIYQDYLDVTIQEASNDSEKLILAPRRKIKVKTGGTEELLTLDEPGYQFSQARGLIIIENNDIGKVAVLPVSMLQVSSVVLSVSTGDTIKKGDELIFSLVDLTLSSCSKVIAMLKYLLI